MTEADIQRQIIKYVELSGGLVFRMNAGKAGRYNTRMAPTGTPDLLIVMKDLSIWVEVKNEKGKLSEGQIDMHRVLKEKGQTVIVARSCSDFLGAIGAKDPTQGILF